MLAYDWYQFVEPIMPQKGTRSTKGTWEARSPDFFPLLLVPFWLVLWLGFEALNDAITKSAGLAFNRGFVER